VSGPKLLELAQQLREQPGVQQAVAFGAALHVSSDDAEALERAIAPFRREPYHWEKERSGLEDVFIHLMEHSKDNFAV
jgi:ABC-2 type transport system ATP-binding protein